VIGAGALLPRAVNSSRRLQTTRPDSRFAGVHVGVNAPYSFHGTVNTADEIAAAMTTAGASGLELRSQPVEAALGGPPPPATGGRGTPEQMAARAAAAQALTDWRLSLSMERVREFKRRYEDAGLAIEIVKFDGVPDMTDAVLDYAFLLARNLGAYALSCEIAEPEVTARLSRFAEKHKVLVGLHGHAATDDEDWLVAFAQGHYTGANVDIGHYVAGNNRSPVPFIRAHHERISHVHLKDRRMNDGPNVPWGQGDTPIREVLQLIRDNGWRIQATIELEYPIPEGSTEVAEVGKCVEYCRDALLG